MKIDENKGNLMGHNKKQHLVRRVGKWGREPNLEIVQYKVDSRWNLCKHLRFHPLSQNILIYIDTHKYVSDIKLIRTNSETR